MKSLDELKRLSYTNPIMLFDGECIFCCKALQFYIKIDKQEILRYTTLQSEMGKTIMHELGLTMGQDESVILLESGNFYTKTDVTFRTLAIMEYPWKVFVIFQWIPKVFRNFIYDIIARNRIKWFGKYDSCIVPEQSIKHLFLL